MDLRTKTLVIFGVGLLIILAGFAVYSSSVLQMSYQNIEKNEVRQDLQRVSFALESELDDLDSHLADWALWDDTYYYTTGSNPGFVEENLPATTFRTLDIDYFILFNNTGGLTYARYFNKTSGDLEPVSPLFLDTITRDYPLLTFNAPDSDSTVKGVLFVGSQPVAVASRPVLKSSGDGPDEGILIMAKNLDEDRVMSISKTTGVSVFFIAPDTLTADRSLAPVQDQFHSGNPVAILTESPDSVQGYVLQPELNITPDTYGIGISEPRTIYQSGISTLYSFLFIIIIATLVLGFLGIFIMDRMILSRISVITNDVRKIGAGAADENVRITEVPGNDELAQLSIAINRMLEQISRSRLLYKSILEDQSELICRFSPDGTITFMNPAFIHKVKDLKNGLEPKSIYDVFEQAVSKEPLDNFLHTLIFKSPSGSGEQEFTLNGLDYTIAWTIRGIFDQNGVLLEYQYVGRDITETKQADAALQQVTRKLTLLNQVTFSDIQNAVFTLNGYLTLERQAPEEQKAEEYHNLEQESIRRIEYSLNFAKQYQDLGVRPPEWQNVQQSFVMAISHLDFSAIHRMVKLDNLEIYASPLLEQVFLALAKNVLTGAKNATEVTIGYTIVKDALVLSFRDNGTGVPDAKKEKIFERGYGSQMGMELFLVREILSITGITIRETGTYGEGALFEIFVPKRDYRFPEKQ